MNDFGTFFIENQMLFYALGCLVLLILFVVFFPINKKKKKKELVEVVEPVEEVKAIESVIENDTPITSEEITIEDIQDLEADDTFIYERVNIENEPKANELDNLLSVMQQDLERQQEHADEVSDYEDEQEKTAIISYQELLQAARENRIQTNYDDEENAVMSTKKIEDPKMEQEVVQMVQALTQKEPVVEQKTAFEVKEEAPKKFKNSEIISPIFGKQDVEVEYPKIPSFKREVINDYKVVSEEKEIKKEIRTTSPEEEFLQTLINFRNSI